MVSHRDPQSWSSSDGASCCVVNYASNLHQSHWKSLEFSELKRPFQNTTCGSTFYEKNPYFFMKVSNPLFSLNLTILKSRVKNGKTAPQCQQCQVNPLGGLELRKNTALGGLVPLWWFARRIYPIYHLGNCHKQKSGWWFGTFFIFPYIGNNYPNWLIFFRGVQTTNQKWCEIPQKKSPV